MKISEHEHEWLWREALHAGPNPTKPFSPYLLYIIIIINMVFGKGGGVGVKSIISYHIIPADRCLVKYLPTYLLLRSCKHA